MDIDEQIKLKNSKTEKKRRETVNRETKARAVKHATEQLCEILSILQSKMKRRGLTKVLREIREL